jgi:flagellar assembly factor FliW
MPVIETPHFGSLEYTEDRVLEFPHGIPAFESERRFLALERPETAPVIFLQSLSRSELVFMTLPVSLVEPGYRGAIPPEDLEALGLEAGRPPEEGREVLSLAIITVDENRSATANLMAPVVVNLSTRRAVQSVQPDSGYSPRHPLPGGCGGDQPQQTDQQ